MATYEEVNRAWGDIRLPPITAAESQAIARKLLPKFMGRKDRRTPWFFRQVNRSWAAPAGTDTASDRANGLPRMVHDMSHWVFEKQHPTLMTHSARHAALEKAMIDHIVAKGWHLPKPEPAPKAKPSKDEVRAQNLARTEASIRRWTQKQRLATTWLRKLNARKRGLERAMKKETSCQDQPTISILSSSCSSGSP